MKYFFFVKNYLIFFIIIIAVIDSLRPLLDKASKYNGGNSQLKQK